jgi:hypothetical protein
MGIKWVGERISGGVPGGKGRTPYLVADALMSVTQRRVLGLLFGEPARAFFATELIALAEGGSGAVQRELARLVGAGLVTQHRVGNRKHYQANPGSLVYPELRSLVRKIVVIPGAIATALDPVRNQVELALLHDAVPVAEGDRGAGIDLLLVSDALSPDGARELLAAAEARLGCPINLSLCTGTEFRLRAARPNTVVARILAGPKIVVMGRLPE